MLHERPCPWYEPSCRPRARDTSCRPRAIWWVVRVPPAAGRRPSHTNTQHNFKASEVGDTCPKSNPAMVKNTRSHQRKLQIRFLAKSVNKIALGNRFWNFTKNHLVSALDVFCVAACGLKSLIFATKIYVTKHGTKKRNAMIAIFSTIECAQQRVKGAYALNLPFWGRSCILLPSRN